MITCRVCRGFIPTHVKVCPNCQTKKVSKCRTSATIVGVGMVSLTLMACYGAPPDYYKSRDRLPHKENCQGEDCDKTEHKDTPDKTDSE